VRNVLVAGRCLLDADEGAFGAVRVMVNAAQTGHAAAAAKAGDTVGRVDLATIRRQPAEQGAIVI
jgi:hypothetical protein